MKIYNKRATHDYELSQHYEAGINLLGSEVKAVKVGHADITGAHARIMGSEVYLVGAAIFPYEYARTDGYDERRTRKLLLHKSEILSLKHKLAGASLTIVPVMLYTTGGLIKVDLALGKGKRMYEKRESQKKKDLKRELDRGL